MKPIEDVFDAAEKAAITEKLTDPMVIVEGEAARPGTWVTIDLANARPRTGQWTDRRGIREVA